MIDDINRFWIPVTQVLPVFILALAIEARAAFAQRLKELSKSTGPNGSHHSRLMVVVDGAADISYVSAFVLAMLLLLGSFLVALGVLAFETHVGTANVTIVFVSTLLGAILTGLLPVVRLFGRVAGANLSRLRTPPSKPSRKRHKS